MSGSAVWRIDRLDGAGRGVGTTEGGERLAFAGALPGESVEVEPMDGGATLLRVLEPSEDRVAPPCAHAARCGGCALQFASDAFLARWKRDRIAAALAREGLETEVAETIVSRPRSRRRVKLAARRGKKGVSLGFFGARSHVIEPIETCLAMRPEIEAALPALRRLAQTAAPRARAIAIWAEISESGLDVGVEEAKPLDPRLFEAAARWAEEEDAARLSWNGEPLASRRPPRRRHGKALAEPPPGAFAQATEEGEAALVGLAREALAGAKRIADLFAGAGTFALPLAENSEVLALEAESALVEALDRAWREAPGLKAVKALRRDLFRRPLLPEEMKGLDAALFDPPRAGAEAQARALALAPAELARLVGVSCNPASFARDAAILAGGGWRLAHVTPIDQFLWTPHVEMIGVFTR